jgi:hypothetical protein
LNEAAEGTETNKSRQEKKTTQKQKIEYEFKATEKEKDINQANKISKYLNSTLGD